jgi:hypothetical protein
MSKFYFIKAQNLEQIVLNQLRDSQFIKYSFEKIKKIKIKSENYNSFK